jgi:Flp pilus assembly protein TadG
MNGESEERHESSAAGVGARIWSGVRRLRDLVRDRAANVYITFALLAPVMLVLIGAGVDYSYAENTKRALQDATDAATLAVSAAVAKNPNSTVAQLQAIAQSVLNADFSGAPSPVISEFHVCAPVQNDCTASTGAMKMNTVALSTQGQAPCTLGALVPMICNASNGSAQNLSAKTTTVIGFGANIQLNLVMDTSASMIVGATPADVTLISNWMGYSTTTTTTTYQQSCSWKNGSYTCTQTPITTTTTTYPNWNAMKPSDPGPAFTGDNPPCAFACHDVSGATSSDIQMGLTNAHTAGATTRFDVMTAAATQLLDHVNTTVTSSSTLAKNTYYFNLYSFDTTLHTWGSSNMSYSTARPVISTITPGLDTHIDDALSSLVTTIGKNGNGNSSTTPLKFVMLVTDGLKSDRSTNWSCTSWATDPNWNYNTCYGGYAAPLNVNNCASMKANGVVLAVLETPYVPLTGQSPAVAPYEKTVRHAIYPGGPNTASAVSAALSNCATPGYYFQATNSSDIATGFITLTDKFLSQMSYISK